MREIKFRVWSIGMNKYIIPKDFRIKRSGELTLNGMEASHAFILEQYTGLKDKNGKEIYEGDILYCRWYFTPMDSMHFLERDDDNCVEVWYEVKYSDAHRNEDVKAGFYTRICNFKGHGQYKNKSARSFSCNHREQGGFYKTEVIGNIYENPELLEKGSTIPESKL